MLSPFPGLFFPSSFDDLLTRLVAKVLWETTDLRLFHSLRKRGWKHFESSRLLVDGLQRSKSFSLRTAAFLDLAKRPGRREGGNRNIASRVLARIPSAFLLFFLYYIFLGSFSSLFERPFQVQGSTDVGGSGGRRRLRQCTVPQQSPSSSFSFPSSSTVTALVISAFDVLLSRPS